MNTRCKSHYKSEHYSASFPLNTSQETVFTDGFESIANWDRSENSFGWALSAIDSSKKKSGTYSGRIDGRSFSIFNPQKVPFYRNFAGLPSANSGTDLIKGIVKLKHLKLGKLFATPIFRDKVTGGLPLEFYLRFKNIQNIKQIPLKSPF